MDFEAFRTYLARQTTADAFSGVVFVDKNGEKVFEYVTGYAHQGFQIANNLETKFNIGSLGKMFTGVAIAQLVEKGLVSFDEVVGTYLTDYPNHEVARNVTIHQLLTHTSGLGTIFNKKFSESRWKLRTVESLLPIFASDPLAFEPGTRWKYSNAAFVVLGRIIEVVTGLSYYSYVKKHIFDTSGMKNTDYYELDQDIPNTAYGYTFRKPFSTDMDYSRGRRNNLLELPVKGIPGGGEYSTALDMRAFCRALTGYTLLSPSMTETILSFKAETDKPYLQYGYAFYLLQTEGHRVIGREGSYAGVSTMFHMYQDLPYTLIVLSNYDNPAALDVAITFAQLVK
jgi:CubicO group peptidase (beta-lactamase class C family)